MFRGWAWTEHELSSVYKVSKLRRQPSSWERTDRESDHPSLTLSVLIRILLETVGLTVTAQIGLHQLSQELCRCSTGFKRVNRRDSLSLSQGKVYWLEVDLPVLGQNRTVFLMQNSKTKSQKQIVFQIATFLSTSTRNH